MKNIQNPIQHTIKSGDLNLCVFEWEGDSPPFLLVHATGFHARCWDQTIKHLQGKHIYAIDLMGHGRSDKPTLPISWNQYTTNVVDLIKAFDLHEIVAAGHSMGGYVVATAAAQLQERFSRLILIDPVIFADKKTRFPYTKPEQMPISRRRHLFSSPEEMMEYLSNKGSFELWDPAVFRDYCVYGLLPLKDGKGYELACPPLIEAATYIGSQRHEQVYEQIKTITLPVDVIRARDRTPEDPPFSFIYSPTNPELAKYFQNGRDLQLTNMSHFIPMQDPKLTAQLVQNGIFSF